MRFNKIFAVIFLFSLASCGIISSSYKSKIDGVYIPKNLDDAIYELDKQYNDSTKQIIKSLSEEDFTSGQHFNSGLGIRNDWNLWKKSRLQKYFIRNGIWHPDDMSGIILKSYYRHVNNQKIDLKSQISFYQNYWEGVELTKLPKAKKFPEQNLEFRYAITYGRYTKSKKWARVYIQTNSSNSMHWIYDYYYGWKKINTKTKSNLMTTNVEVVEAKMDSIFH